MARKIYINKSLLTKIHSGEETSDISVIDIEEGIWIMDKTEGCVELIGVDTYQ